MNNYQRCKKRALLAAFDVVALVCVCVPLVMIPQPAYAYVDPSVMTYTIQALAGVAVALSAVLGVAFRRTRKKILNLLNIDENANKIVDPTWVRVDEEGKPVVSESCGDAAAPGGYSKAKEPKRDFAKGDAPSWIRRLVLSLVVVGFCGFTLGIVAPYEIVAGSAGSLLFNLGDVWALVAVVTFVAVLLLALLLSFVPGKAFTSLLVFLFCGGLCCYIQAMFLNTGLPLANGSTVDYWNEHGVMMVVSTIVWLVVLVAPQFFIWRNRLRAQSTVVALSVCLIVVQSVGVASLFMSLDETKSPLAGGDGPLYVTEDGLFEVSGENNVIVFVLDRFDTYVMNDLVDENPAIMEDMPGFTFYDNHAGLMVPTLYAIPNMLTGQVPQAGEPIEDYVKQRYIRGSFLKDIEALGYSTGLYSDTLELESLSDAEVAEYVGQYTTNIHSLNNFSLDNKGVVLSLAKCALYRDMPWIIKWRFWFYTDEVNQRAANYSSASDPENTIYTMDDQNYLSRLRQFGLSFADDSEATGSFKLIHLNGPHDPYVLNAYAEYVGIGNSNELEQAKGSLFIVQQYIDELKRLGVYEDSTIIVTSDHGAWYSSLSEPTEPISPLLMIKPAGSGSGDVFSRDSTPVGQADFQATVLEAMGGDGSRYGGSYLDDYPLDRTRDFYMITSDGGYVIDMFKYEISGDVLNMSDWRVTDEKWHVRDL